MIGERQGAHPELARPLGQLVYPARPVQEAVVRVDVEVDEVLVGRGHAGLTKISAADAQAGTLERGGRRPLAVS